MRAAAFFTLLALTSPVFAEIYKTVDAHGNVVFTDTPPANTRVADDSVDSAPEAQPITLQKPNTFETRETRFEVPRRTQNDEESFTNYESITVTAPTADESIRENAGTVPVSLIASPPLQDGHTFVLHLDGSEVLRGAEPDTSLSNVDRGTHELVASIFDPKQAKILISSPAIRFHLRRHSTQHPKPANAPAPGTPGAAAPNPGSRPTPRTN